MTVGRAPIDAQQLSYELRRNPQLWNKHAERVRNADSPHREVADVWLRYAATHAEGIAGPHESVWYPEADILPSLRKIVYNVSSMVQSERLGGVLITKVPAGGKVYPHVDPGWHAGYYDKFAVQLEAHPQQAFCFEDGQHVTAVGDIYWFDNQHSHWVINDSPVDRITLFVCCRTAHSKSLGDL